MTPFVGVRPAGWLGDEPTAQIREILNWATYAEELGFDVFFVGDRLLAAVADGANPVYGAAMLDPFVLLSGVAARTSKIRLATLVAVVPYRHPASLAKITASLDVLSGGRFILGAGSGWNHTELAMFGVDRRKRGRQMEEGLKLIRRLWDGEAITEDGEFWNLDGIRIEPTPDSGSAPPIWLGSFTPADIATWSGDVSEIQHRALSRVGRVADGWVPLTYSVVNRARISGAQLARCWEIIAEAAEEVDRDPAKIEIIYAHWIAVVRNPAERAACEEVLARYFPGDYEEARNTYLIGTPEEIVEQIRETTSSLDRVDGYLFTPLSDERTQLQVIAEEIRPLLDAS
jgi:probable F420-dependent oxidoreductase